MTWIQTRRKKNWPGHRINCSLISPCTIHPLCAWINLFNLFREGRSTTKPNSQVLSVYTQFRSMDHINTPWDHVCSHRNEFSFQVWNFHMRKFDSLFIMNSQVLIQTMRIRWILAFSFSVERYAMIQNDVAAEIHRLNPQPAFELTSCRASLSFIWPLPNSQSVYEQSGNMEIGDTPRVTRHEADFKWHVWEADIGFLWKHFPDVMHFESPSCHF